MTSGYKQTEVGLIPVDWDIRSIAQIAPLQRGFDLPTTQIKDGPYPVVYSNGVMNYHATTMAHGPGVVTGRSGTLGKVHYVDADYWPHNTSLWVTRFNGNVPRFVYYLYTGIGFVRFASGSGVPTLNRNDAHAFRVPLPPTKAEQQAIAAALSDADALIESLGQLIAKKRHLKQGAMQELLTGKKRLPGFSGEWEVKRLGDIAKFYSGGTPPTAIVSYYGGDIPWITSGDLNKSAILEVGGRITKPGLENSSAKMIEENTLLIALYGATSGVTAISKIQAAINQAVLAIIPKNDSSTFLFFKLSYLKDWIISTYTQGGQPNLSGDIVKSIEITLPIVEEQTAIATILSDMDAEIAALESKLAKTRSLKQGMMHNLLTGKIRLI